MHMAVRVFNFIRSSHHENWLLKLMEAEDLHILLRGLSRLHIYPPSGAYIRMIQDSEKV